MTIVCNTLPISNLAVIGQLLLLQQVYNHIVIPNAVAEEIARVASIYVQAASVPSQPWITIQSVKDTTTVQRLKIKKLDAGESEAIALALELKAELLIIDEQLGRNLATKEGLNITGLIGVLLEAKHKNLIAKVKPILDELIIQARFRVSLSLYNEVLKLAKEKFFLVTVFYLSKFLVRKSATYFLEVIKSSCPICFLTCNIKLIILFSCSG